MRRLPIPLLGRLPVCRVLEQWRRLPFAERSALTNDAPVLVLAPHPDDESFGCGGLIAECRAHGQDVRVIVLTDGSASHPGSREYPPQRLAALRMDEVRAAVEVLGLPSDRIDFLGLPDGRAPLGGRSLRAAADRVLQYASAFSAGSIFTTCRFDPHPDHVAAYRIGRLVARKLRAKLLSYPIWAWMLPPTVSLPAARTEGARLNIEPYLPLKRRAIACHRSQLSDLVRDVPAGLTTEFLAIFEEPFEVFLEE